MYFPHLEQTKPFTFTHAIAEKSKFARNLKNPSILVCSRLLGRHSPTFVPGIPSPNCCQTRPNGMSHCSTVN